MGHFKPFLFGTVFGLGFAFVALQFHLVRSHEGFRLVPRTPQPSIGLAYADIRNWGAEEWADRPELARALVAHGSTDLVATSVSGGLIESISAEGSALDKLRGLMNDSVESFGADSSAEQSGLLVIPKDRDTKAGTEVRDIFSIPFPQDARKNATGSMTADDDFSGKSAPSIAFRELPSIDDILGSGSNIPDNVRPTQQTAPKEISGTSSSLSAARETEALEEFLFGHESSGVADPPDSSAGFGVFDDISSKVQQRVEDSLNNAGTGIHNDAGSAVEDAASSLDRYMRQRVKERVPESVSSMFREDGPASLTDKLSSEVDLPPALKAIQDGFDPFVR